MKQYSLEIAGGLTLLLGPIGMLLGAALLLYTHWHQIWLDMKQWAMDFVHDLDVAWQHVDSALRTAWGAFEKFFKDLWKDIDGAARVAWGAIEGFFLGVWHAIDNTARSVWGAIESFFVGAWNAFLGVVNTIWGGILAAILFVWHTLETGVMNIWNLLRDFLVREWTGFQNIASAVWNVISTVVQTVWHVLDGIIRAVWTGLRDFLIREWQGFQNIAQAIWNLFSTVVQAVWHVLDSIIRSIWNTLRDFLTAEWHLFVTVATTIWNLFYQGIMNIWHVLDGAVRGVWGGIKTFLTNEWNGFVGFATSIWQGVANGVNAAWTAISNGFSRTWNGLKGAFQGGVNDIITIINGFISALDLIPFVNIHKIGLIGAGGGGGAAAGPIGTGGTQGGTRRTGAAGLQVQTVGQGFRTAGEIIVAGEGNAAFPEYVIPTDPTYRASAIMLTRALLDDMGVRKMAGGGLFGKILDTVKNFVGGVMSPAVGAAQKVADAAAGHLPFPINDLGKEAVDAIGTALKSILSGGKASPGTGGPVAGYSGSPGVAQWTPIAQAVANMLGQPGSVGAILRRIQFESGGNPYAVNKSDSNWAAGHPSVGLAQVINSTFRAYAGQFVNTGPFAYGVSEDPLSNVYAGMNYATRSYGSIAAVDPLVRPEGYDQGGLLMPGYTLAANFTGKPERVLAPGQSSASITIANGAIQVPITVQGNIQPGQESTIAQAVQAGVTQALTDVLGYMDGHQLATTGRT